MGTLLNVGAFFSGRVQNGFETQNWFTRSGFRGIPSLVPKFAFLVVEIGLRKKPNLRIFQKLRLCTKSWCIYFWFGSEGIGCFKHVSQGYICTCEFFLHKMAVLLPQKDSEDLQFEIFFNFFLQILGAFFSGRVQNAFQTQNGFTWNIFRGMPSSVPRLTFFKDF